MVSFQEHYRTSSDWYGVMIHDQALVKRSIHLGAGALLLLFIVCYWILFLNKSTRCPSLGHNSMMTLRLLASGHIHKQV